VRPIELRRGITVYLVDASQINMFGQPFCGLVGALGYAVPTSADFSLLLTSEVTAFVNVSRPEPETRSRAGIPRHPGLGNPPPSN